MAILYLIAAILMMTAPLSGVLYAAGWALNKYVFTGRRWATWALVGLGIILMMVGDALQVKCVPWELGKALLSRMDSLHLFNLTYEPVSIGRWLLSDPGTLGAALALEAVALHFAPYTPERIALAGVKLRERKRQKLKKIRRIPETSQICVGVTGYGKSAFIARSVDDILAEEPDAHIVVVDGKGSTEKYSLYDSMQTIAKKRGRNLALINCTSNDALGGEVYDFLAGIDRPEQAVEMLMTLIVDPTVEVSSGSEFYRRQTEAYIQRVIMFMFKMGIDVTFANVVQLLNIENLRAMMEDRQTASSELSILLKEAEQLWPDVSASVGMLETLLMGQGSRLFALGEGRSITNMREAYKRGDLVLVLADELSMPSLAGKIVQLTTMDLRNLASSRLENKTDMDRKIYIYLDEFASYVSAVPIIKSLYNKIRAAKMVITIATQSCSDILGLFDGWFHSLCDSTGRFVFFRQNSSESAEAVAGIMGTEDHVTSTFRTSGLGFTGEASNTVDKQYRVHPDTIRHLRPNHGILYEAKTGKISFFRNEFLSR